ncbi:MAG: SemiSWEET transporter [Candidatus Omnitrophica bacterium]|nr:SemiSWEET transporter [Candidatus Omnitrophota bacterium]
MFWELIGIAAASLTMFSFFPQIFKVLRTKSVKDVSPIMLLQLSGGVSLWIVYGLHLKNLIIILANSITLFSLIVLLILYMLYIKR